MSLVRGICQFPFVGEIVGARIVRPRAWCAAQRIKIAMLAGSKHTITNQWPPLQSLTRLPEKWQFVGALGIKKGLPEQSFYFMNLSMAAQSSSMASWSPAVTASTMQWRI